ncbi:MAG: NADP(H)-dependent aldo-keto reductase [Gammaproteobacteria bacterium]|nr:NADP(H)-dependent aldo-keto reductase [Gammaproteobacteria bacterium]
MQFKPLGRTDLKVSQLCLGTMTWGEQNTETEAHAQLNYAVDAGINFIDTAELYPVPPRAETQGRTEEYLGTWLCKCKYRDKLIIATKVCAAADWIPYIRNGKTRLNHKNIEIALNASLKRLQTDYIDLYQLHWPERDTNYFGKLGYYHVPEKDGVPIAETLEALGGFIQSGKIRYIGISNETPWGIAEYLRISGQKGLPRIVTIQNPYNLLNRTFEIGLAEFAHREDVGLMAYSPLGFGVLSGKYLNGTRPKGARLTLFNRFSRYLNEQGIKCTEAYVELARNNGLDPAQMALAFINSRSFLISNIIGATSMEQLKMNIASIDIKLSKELLVAIEDIHTRQPNPCP